MKEFEQSAEQLLQKNKAPGAIVAIAKDGKVVYTHSFGYATRESQQAATEQTVFGLASLTKSFTCLAIMQLQEQGLLRVTDAVQTYLPSFRLKDASTLSEITIHHLMTHTSGIPPMDTIDYAMIMEDSKPWFTIHMDQAKEVPALDTYDLFMEFIAAQDVTVLGPPGEIYSYSNEGYSLLGAIIEQVSGLPYTDYIEKRITKPLGMKHTHFLKADYPAGTDFSTCYEKNEGEEQGEIYPVMDWWDAPAMRATGFLKSTVADMIRYSQVFIQHGTVEGKTILQPSSVQEMMASQVRMDYERNYGYGLSVIEDYFGHRLVDHGGSLPAISSKFTCIPSLGITAITFVNLMGVPSYKIQAEALNAYFGRALDASPFNHQPIDIDYSVFNTYIGDYTSGEGTKASFQEIEGTRTFTYDGKTYPFFFVEPTVCIVQMEDGTEPVEFFLSDTGQVTGLSIYHRMLTKEVGDSLCNN